MTTALSRREWLGQASAAAAGLTLTTAAPAAGDPAEPFGYCLNTSTISGQKLDLVEIVEIAAKAGYQAIEPWSRELEQYAKSGRSLKELGQRLQDRGLKVANVIAFFEWIVDDEERRKKGLEEARRLMDLVRTLGGNRIAAPPAGATSVTDLDLVKAGQRYRALLELGAKMGVVPQLEFWGPSKSLNRLSEAAFIALEAGHPQAAILADVYHLYKGGSRSDGLALLSGSALNVLHCNDYPANPPRGDITDAQRIYPGDGIAPLKEILRSLRQIGYRGVLSLELFNRDLWKQDAQAVARTGLEKMRALVRSSTS